MLQWNKSTHIILRRHRKAVVWPLAKERNANNQTVSHSELTERFLLSFLVDTANCDPNNGVAAGRLRIQFGRGHGAILTPLTQYALKFFRIGCRPPDCLVMRPFRFNFVVWSRGEKILMGEGTRKFRRSCCQVTAGKLTLLSFRLRMIVNSPPTLPCTTVWLVMIGLLKTYVDVLIVNFKDGNVILISPACRSAIPLNFEKLGQSTSINA